MGMSIEHVAEANRTTAMGLHQAVYAIGMFAGPWLSGALADAMDIQPMFGVTAFVCLALGLLVARQLGMGAKLVLASRRCRETAVEIAHRVEYVELTTHPRFVEEYTAALMLPR